jgi:hypothetical protein
MSINIIIRDKRPKGERLREDFAKRVLGGYRKEEEKGGYWKSRYSKNHIKRSMENHVHEGTSRDQIDDD